jgi:hypothetical protein|tara:strand:- start:1601 stop:1894 length:294 start_codon:yes stop_codon:yes gene_type:complete
MYYLVLSWSEGVELIVQSMYNDDPRKHCPLCYKSFAEYNDITSMIRHLRRCYVTRKIKWALVESSVGDTYHNKIEIITSVVDEVEQEIGSYVNRYIY